jgi:tol-pal system protein YbgF
MKSAPKTLPVILILAVFAILGGCVSKSDFDALQQDQNNTSKELLALQRNVYSLNTDIRTQLEDLKKRTADLKREVADLNGEVKSKVGFLEKEMESSSQPMRRHQADLGARIDKMQVDVQTLMGRFEEGKYFADKNLQETKALKEAQQAKIEELNLQIAELKKSLEAVPKKPEGQEKEKPAEGEPSPERPPDETPSKPEATPPTPPTKVAEKPSKTAAVTPEDAYNKAYELYKKGNISAARDDFKRFLAAHPKSKLTENAHFWLGECYFAEKKYDEAILEFDEVIKRFPKGNKVPDALFRQGMAFLEMKDTMNAKLIFKEVVKRYPRSEQAGRAQKKLKELP